MECTPTRIDKHCFNDRKVEQEDTLYVDEQRLLTWGFDYIFTKYNFQITLEFQKEH